MRFRVRFSCSHFYHLWRRKGQQQGDGEKGRGGRGNVLCRDRMWGRGGKSCDGRRMNYTRGRRTMPKKPFRRSACT